MKIALDTTKSEMSELETRNDMLRSASQSEVKHDDLVAACESDKVAASRAMKQNKQLKEENVELQSALVELVSLRNRISI